MMKYILRQLTVVRLIISIGRLLMVVGKWESKIFRNIFRRSSVGFSFQLLWRSWRWITSVLMIPLRIYWASSAYLSKRSRARQQRLDNQRQQKALRIELAPRQSQEPGPKQRAMRTLAVGSFLKPAIAFAVLIMIIVLPLKFYDAYRFFSRLEAKVMNFSQAAIGNLDSAKDSALNNNLDQAQLNLSQASQDFMMLSQELAGVDGLVFKLASLAPSKKLKLASSGQQLAQLGQLGSELALELTSAADALMNDRAGKNFSQVLSGFQAPAVRALAKLNDLELVWAQIDVSALPEEYRASFLLLKDKSSLLKSSLSELVQTVDYLQIFLGQDIDKRYLLVFQNNTEVRATGGFMGSFALIDFKQGQIKSLKSPGGGTYDTEGGLRRLVQAPKPMWLVNPLWHFWDCNWWPDWPKSASKVMWFYEKSDGPSVDGVISLTPNVVIRLLEIIGPIDLRQKHGVIVNADNFMETVQSVAEQENEETKEPKQIIGDMLAVMMERLSQNLSREDWVKIIKSLEISLSEKDILIYLTDTKLQGKIADLGWDGALKSAEGDYLSVINTNIGGAKSDKKIIQTITHQASLTADGSIIDTVTIVRDHQAIRGEPFSGVRNVNWLRVYVPLGSRLISSEGWRSPDVPIESPDPAWDFDLDLKNEAEAQMDPSTGTLIYREADKTVFANWSMMDPGEMAVIKLVYKLPFKAKLQSETDGQTELWKYSLLAQKQAGAHNSEISSRLSLPEGLITIWKYPELNTDSFYQQNTDRAWGYLIRQR